jgi:uncharacterized protein (DUF362 family)
MINKAQWGLSFMHLHKVFESLQSRSVEQLSMFYQNEDQLRKSIESVAQNVLQEPNILFGKKVLIKPNWVTHNRVATDAICLRTHDSFVTAFLKIILEQKPQSIVIGDAPIQSCDWSIMVDPKFIGTVSKLSSEHNIPIAIKDFRRVVFDPIKNLSPVGQNSLSGYTIFDLGNQSALEPISTDSNSFRVTCYDPDRLAESHRLGVHKYCIARNLFDADIVFSLPKVKTHQKTGITCALKNLVGLNGDKDYLPHHRVGGSLQGGDCYPGRSPLRRIAESFLDRANRHQGKHLYRLWNILALLSWKMSLPTKVHHLDAGWHGNDTTWRMVFDLNRIAVYGRPDGTIANKPQRTLYSLSDGIIGGQGNGPLHPDPLALGFIGFSNDAFLNDVCMDNTVITLDRTPITFAKLMEYAIAATPPPGWQDHLAKT